MRFEKWQALGNDYIVLEEEALPFELTPGRIAAICEPHLGCHSDGILLLSRPEDSAAHVAKLRIFNPDGSEAGLSGNGAREAILYLRRSGWTDRDEFTVLTAAGEITPVITGSDTARVAMAQATTISEDFPGGPDDGRGTIHVGGSQREFQHVGVGNPQCAIEIADIEELEGLGHPVATRVLRQGLVVLGEGSHVEEGGHVAEGVDPLLALAALAPHVDETARRAKRGAHTQTASAIRHRERVSSILRQPRFPASHGV